MKKALYTYSPPQFDFMMLIFSHVDSPGPNRPWGLILLKHIKSYLFPFQQYTHVFLVKSSIDVTKYFAPIGNYIERTN
jgi:hypothetical protein